MREKNYGIDVLRVLAMFMVTILHILTQGGILRFIRCQEQIKIL